MRPQFRAQLGGGSGKAQSLYVAGSAVGGGSTAFPSGSTVIPRAGIAPGSFDHHLLAQRFQVFTGH